MQTIREIKQATIQYGKTHPTNVYKNRNISLRLKSVIEYLDDNDNIYKEIRCTARDTSKDNAGLSTKKSKKKKKTSTGKRLRNVVLRVWPTATKQYNDNSWIHVSCTCEFFKYYCDEALWANHSSWFIDKSVHNRPEDKPLEADPSKNNNITNPHYMTWVCKHISTALRANYHKKKSTDKKKTRKKPILLRDTIF